MNLHDLKPNPGAKHRRKRLGCGESSGLGKTSGKGHKGQKSRSGGTIRPGFEGGQMPLHRRLPKRGFNNTAFQKKIEVVNLKDLDRCFDGSVEVDRAALKAAGLVRGQFDLVKVLGDGTVSKALTVQVDRISATARQKIEAAGGHVHLLGESADA